jgi:hypothetical protein
VLDGVRLYRWQPNDLKAAASNNGLSKEVLLKIISLVSIVLLLGWMFYFVAGGLPLLVLKFDHPTDARMVRGFFEVHYLVLMTLAAAGTLSSAFSGRPLLTAAIACIALTGFAARRAIVSRMDQLRSTISVEDIPAKRKFRTLHITGIVLNILLMVGFITALIFSSADVVSCVETPSGCRGEGCRIQCSLL